MSTDMGSICRRRIVSVDAAATWVEAAGLMREHHVGALVVTQTNAEQEVVGIVSLDDLMHACAAQMEGVAKVIRSGIEREIAQTAAPEPIVLRIPAMGTAGWGQPIA